MLGVYDYTVILTYLSLISANVGIFLSLGTGHEYAAALCLMFCGLFDAFDGKVARLKKNRTEFEKKFGIQIDSLTDVVSFGVLPACIGVECVRTSSVLSHASVVVRAVLMVMLAMFVLAAMIRLAFFNVTEEERQSTEDGNRVYYVGVPVTVSSLVFPTILLIQYILDADLAVIYLVFIVITGFAFITESKVHKPGFKEIMIMVGIGAVELLIMLFVWIFLYK